MNIRNQEYEQREDCPDIQTLIQFVLGDIDDVWIRNHLEKCEICADMAEGIATFKEEKKDITLAEILQQFHDDDEAYLNTIT